jgi:hypothetical protein
MKKWVGGFLAISSIVGFAGWLLRRVDDTSRRSRARSESTHPARPRRASAYDPTAMEVAARHQVNAERQSVIDAVLRSHGGRPARQIVPALRAALHSNGLSAEPDTWLRAVATELANGHVYMVSQASVDSYSTSDGSPR